MIPRPRRAALTWLLAALLAALGTAGCLYVLPGYFDAAVAPARDFAGLQTALDVAFLATVSLPIATGISTALACLAAAWTAWRQPDRAVAARMHAYPLWALALGGGGSALMLLGLLASAIAAARGVFW